MAAGAPGATVRARKARVLTTVVSALLSVVLVSLLSLAGLLTLSMQEARLRQIAGVFVSFAVGALLGDAFIHLIPETLTLHAAAPLKGSLLVLGGVLAFFVVEKLLRHRHQVLAEDHEHDEERHRPELAAMNVMGDTIHNFADGVLIGASWLASPALGLSTTVAVALHELPQELADFSILIHAGVPVKKAVLLNLASASAAIVGTAVALGAGSVAQDAVAAALVPITAGGFVYIAAANLVPELQRDRRKASLLWQTGLIALGIAVMGLLTLVA